MTAADASYFSPTKLTEITGAGVEVIDTFTAVASTGYPAIAIWDVRRSMYDTTNHQQLEPVSRTVVFDRRTAQLINCCGGNINGDALIRQAGIAGWAFPAGTRKQTYYVFDTVLNKPEPATYSGTETVDGIAAYTFTQDIPVAKAGFSPLSPTDPELYSMHRVYWVDPEVGMLLNVTESEDLYLVTPTTGAVVTHLFRADLHTTSATVRRLASQDARSRHQIALGVQRPQRGVRHGVRARADRRLPARARAGHRGAPPPAAITRSWWSVSTRARWTIRAAWAAVAALGSRSVRCGWPASAGPVRLPWARR